MANFNEFVKFVLNCKKKVFEITVRTFAKNFRQLQNYQILFYLLTTLMYNASSRHFKQISSKIVMQCTFALNSHNQTNHASAASYFYFPAFSIISWKAS